MSAASEGLSAQAPTFTPSTTTERPPRQANPKPKSKGGNNKAANKKPATGNNNTQSNGSASSAATPQDSSGAAPIRGKGKGKGKGKNQPKKLAAGENTPPPATDPNTASSATTDPPSKGPQHKGKAGSKGKGKGKPKSAVPTEQQTGQPEASTSEPPPAPTPAPNRRNKMNTKLTTNQSDSKGDNNNKSGASSSLVAPLQDDYPDLRSRLVAELSNGAYECAICCGVVSVRSAIWSCARCCAVLHLKCAQMWAKANLAQATEAWRIAHPEQDSHTALDGEITWRCPGCQSNSSRVPNKYTCWCGSVTNPDHTACLHNHPPGAFRVPHGCGKSCPKGQCEHGCPTLCHPGACPPCPIVVTRECFCGRKTISARCSQLSSHQTGPVGISCGVPCGKPLACGSHVCTRPCHAGPCGNCVEMFERACYCGRHTKVMACGHGDVVSSTAPIEGGQVKEWNGYFACEDKCARPFACGVHSCEQGCHAHGLEPGVCPKDPSVVLTCPCGASSHATTGELKDVQDAVHARSKCTDPVPTCHNPCGKSLPCGHKCSASCHEGPCPACHVPTTRPCRCGNSTVTRACTDWSTPSHDDAVDPATGDVQPTCKVVCGAPLSCGKHSCTRSCCPLAFLNPKRVDEGAGHSKRSGLSARDAIAAAERHALFEEASAAERALADPYGLHNCPAVCGKPLDCGNHTCERTCHRGACGRCLNASFEEMSCACGGTVLEPPIPCGMVVACRLPCHRPGPPCGHPKVSHQCHPDEQDCPPCVYLTTKLCHCGKTHISNVPCSRDRARIACGKPCDSVLNCGYHRCTGKCHIPGEDCGRCTQLCWKPRPSCGHPCQLRCHAPSVCSEDEPCTVQVELRCPCGYLRQTVPCGTSVASKDRPRERQLKCSDACTLAKRNARLAEALGLPPPTAQVTDASGAPAARGPKIAYPTALLDFARTRRAETERVEKAIRDFFVLPLASQGSNNSFVLPPAKPEVREFTRLLARLYRLDARDVDRDPKRSVMLSRPPAMLAAGAGAMLPRPTLKEALAEQAQAARVSAPSVTLSTQVRKSDEPNAYVLDGLFGLVEDDLRAALPALAKPRTQLVWLTDSRVLIARPQHSDWRSDAQAAVSARLQLGNPRVYAAKVEWSLTSEEPKLKVMAPTPLVASSATTPPTNPWFAPTPAPARAGPGTPWSAIAARAAAPPPAPSDPAMVDARVAATLAARRATEQVPESWDD